jgi:hypothetical protein
MASDQRKSVRILVPASQAEAVLCRGRQQVAVQMVDASAGGLALAAPDSLKLVAGDLLRLGTEAGWQEVQVVRLENYADGLLVGVERIADIPDALVAKERGHSRAGTLSRLMLLGLMAFFAAVLAANYQASHRGVPRPPITSTVATDAFQK